jgi:glycosyltransferase involved in cell wall biosynthesis
MTEAGRPGPIRVLRVIARLNVGGPARHVVLLDRGLQARGWKTLLVHGSIGAGEASLEHFAAEHGVHTQKIDELGRRLNPFSDLRAFLKLLNLTFRERPHIVHTHTAKAGTLGRLAALMFNVTQPKRRRCIVLHTFHGHVFTGYFSSPASWLVKTVERVLGTVTDRVITISPAQRRDIVERFRIADADRTVVVPLGLNLAPFLKLPADAETLRASLDIPASDFVVGFIGRFVPIKDLQTLVTAFGAAHRRLGGMWLLLAGDGPSRPSVESAARVAGVADRVRFLGWVDDLSRFYASLDVCALSSLNEGTPVALIEAMAAGKAVVATRVGGIPDLIEDGRTGMLVNAGDSQAMSQVLVELASNPQKRSLLGQNARNDVLRFSTDRLVDDVDRLYRELLSAT